MPCGWLASNEESVVDTTPLALDPPGEQLSEDQRPTYLEKIPKFSACATQLFSSSKALMFFNPAKICRGWGEKSHVQRASPVCAGLTFNKGEAHCACLDETCRYTPSTFQC